MRLHRLSQASAWAAALLVLLGPPSAPAASLLGRMAAKLTPSRRLAASATASWPLGTNPPRWMLRAWFDPGSGLGTRAARTRLKAFHAGKRVEIRLGQALQRFDRPELGKVRLPRQNGIVSPLMSSFDGYQEYLQVTTRDGVRRVISLKGWDGSEAALRRQVKALVARTGQPLRSIDGPVGVDWTQWGRFPADDAMRARIPDLSDLIVRAR